MCNITYLPSGVEVPEEEIQNAATWNQDGHGWAVAAAHGVMLTGRYMDIDTALTTFKATRKAFADKPAMFHSRLATHGTVTLDNVHPFTVGKYAAVAHNGILPGKFQPEKDGKMSDTAIMARFWLAGRAQISGVWTRKERRRIGRIIGTGNKLAILSVSPFLPEPRGYLVNAAQGTWDASTGAWFSSDSYLYPWTASKKASGYTGWLWDSDGYSWDYGTGYGKGIGRREFEPYDRCPACGHSDELDRAAGVCLTCDFCLDCQTALTQCQCYYANNSMLSAEEAREQGEDNESQLSDEIEVRISEIESGYQS